MNHKFYIGQEEQEEKVFHESDVELFAQVSGDKNPLHLNDTYAEKSRFGRKIVHGILVSSLISKIIGMKLPGEGSIYLEQNIRFRKPVYVDEKVIVKVTIIEINQNKFTLKTNVYNMDDECLIEGDAKVLYEEIEKGVTKC
ncbi:MaoC family dehydratase [Roseburia sp. 1XD42-69]|uniref:MaoC family dehydratase n=1 Tax=Roseburia sp. 1XD42-69 TaxID=2320088 RepID=UPI000EA130E6|nr:MaoC family dehydratase [Roseburia sp. 1XD42-69]RKJ60325.1 MaoC family dehydratase [Roseburia sp. 1XD42-69]